MAHRNILLRFVGAMTSPDAQKEWDDLYVEYHNITRILLRKWWIVIAIIIASSMLGFYIASQKVLLKASEASVPFISPPVSSASLRDAIINPDARKNATNDLLSSALRDQKFAKDFSIAFFSYFRSQSENQSISSDDWQTLRTFFNINDKSISENQAVEILASLVSADVFITPLQHFSLCRALFCVRVSEAGKLSILITGRSEGRSKVMIEAIVYGLEKAIVEKNKRTSIDRELSAQNWNQELATISTDLRNYRSEIIEKAIKIRHSLILKTRNVSFEEKNYILENPLRYRSSDALTLPQEFATNLKWQLQVIYEEGRISRPDKTSFDKQIEDLEISLLKYNSDFGYFGSQVSEYGSIFNKKHEFLPTINQERASIAILRLDQEINDKKREFVFYPLLGAFTGIMLSIMIAAAIIIGYKPNRSTIQSTRTSLDTANNNC